MTKSDLKHLDARMAQARLPARRAHAKRWALGVTLLALLAATGCGVKGDLTPAGPIWGDASRTPPPLPEPFTREPDEDEADTSVGRLPGS